MPTTEQYPRLMGQTVKILKIVPQDYDSSERHLSRKEKEINSEYIGRVGKIIACDNDPEVPFTIEFQGLPNQRFAGSEFNVVYDPQV